MKDELQERHAPDRNRRNRRDRPGVRGPQRCEKRCTGQILVKTEARPPLAEALDFIHGFGNFSRSHVEGGTRYFIDQVFTVGDELGEHHPEHGGGCSAEAEGEEPGADLGPKQKAVKQWSNRGQMVVK